MPTFKVTWRNSKTDVTSAILEFPSKDVAWANAIRSGWTVTDVVESDEPVQQGMLGRKRRTGYIKGNRMIRMCKTVGAMLKGKMKMHTALELYAKGLSDRDLAHLLMRVVHKITKEGEPPHLAFRSTGRFDSQFIAIVKASDQSSSIGRGLRKIANRLEKQKGLVNSLIGELAIPALAIIVGTIGFVVLQYGGVRTMEDLIHNMRVDPGPIMGFVFALSGFTRGTWPIFAVTIASIVAFLAVTPKAREAILVVLMSRIKTLREMIMGMRQLSILSTMDLILNCYGPNSGLGMMSALKSATDVSEGSTYHEELKRVTSLYESGGMPLGAALEANSSFDPQITQLLGLGEETNSSGDQVDNLCEMYEELTSDAMNRFKMTAYIFALLYAVVIVLLIAAGVIFPLLLLGPKMINSSGPVGM